MKTKEKTSEFNCLECGDCCRTPGYVYINPDELKKISEFLKMSIPRFKKDYVVREGERIRFSEGYSDPCLFLEKGRCSIYPVRPKQCTSFPFWLEYIKKGADRGYLKRLCGGYRMYEESVFCRNK